MANKAQINTFYEKIKQPKRRQFLNFRSILPQNLKNHKKSTNFSVLFTKIYPNSQKNCKFKQTLSYF